MTREQTIKEIRTHVKNIRHIISSPCGWFNVNGMQISFLSVENKPITKIEFDENTLYIWNVDNKNNKDSIILSIMYSDINKIF